MKANEILAQRAKVVNDMQSMLNVAEKDNRDLNDTEKEIYNKMESDVVALKERADRIANQEKLSADLDIVRGESAKASVGGSAKSVQSSKEYKEVFNGWARNGQITPEVRNALQVGTNSEGGYIVPEEFETMLVAKIQDVNPLRQWCNVITTASDRNIPIESTLGTAAWAAEEATTAESDAAFGQVVLNAYKLSTLVKVSEELMADSFFDISSYLANNFGSRFALAEEAAFVNGDGSAKPTGIVGGATDSGITFAGTAAITADELIDTQHGLTRPYRANAVWMVNDSTLKMIRKLKDGDNQYLWQTGLVAGAPDTLLGRPIYSSTAMPAATTGLKSVVFGDLSGYTIADRTGRTIQRLNELYAVTGQVGFRAFGRCDGKVTDSNKIVYAKQAAA